MAIPELAAAVEAVSERRPELFVRLPDRLFAPLSSTNRHQYWRLLCALHDRRFGPDAPMPPSAGFTVRDIVRDIEEELAFIDDWVEDTEDVVAPAHDGRAHSIFVRLRSSGWLRLERHGAREMVNMAPAVAQFLSRLVEFAQTGPLFVAGKVRSIEANVSLVTSGQADGDSLQEAAAQARSLLEHIRNTGTNVRDLMAALGKETVTAEYVRRFFSDFVERVFIGDYRTLRTRDHPLARRQTIVNAVEALHADNGQRNRLLLWYSEKRSRGDARRAEVLFERDIQRLVDLQRIDEYLDRLDDEIRRANRQALAYLDYRLRAVRPIDHLVQAAILAVQSDDGVATYVPVSSGYLMSHERLAPPRVSIERTPASPLRNEVPSPEEEARAWLMLKARDARSITPPKLAAFVLRQSGGQPVIDSPSFEISCIEDVRALQTLSTIGLANYGESPYLRAAMLYMQRGFRVRQDGESEASNRWLSHATFEVEIRNTRARMGTAA